VHLWSNARKSAKFIEILLRRQELPLPYGLLYSSLNHATASGIYFRPALDRTQNMPKTILLTGGAGFIGSHICVELARAGFTPLLLDNFSNSKHDVVPRLARIVGAPVECVQGDIRDGALLKKIFAAQPVHAVIHLAGLKAVGESVANPLMYYDNNVVGTLRLLEAMREADVRSLVFSSSCTVYGEPQKLPIDESHPLRTASPYGQTKLVIEEMMRDLHRADPRWHIALLRYFNPVGAHESALIGEDPNDIPNNLMPFVLKVASGQYKELSVWGSDYATADGTGVRDYIHVVDLAEAHVKAMECLHTFTCEAVNLGTGDGSSVLDVVKTFERVNGVKIPYVLKARRSGDVPAAYADASFALKRIGWKAERGLDAMCRDAWKWKTESK